MFDLMLENYDNNMQKYKFHFFKEIDMDSNILSLFREKNL